MATTAAEPAADRPGVVARARHRIQIVLGGLVAGILGVAPHVLHHVGPLAGAALFAGIGGTLLFGAVGLVLAIPTLLKIHRHTGGWRVPAAALAAMAAVFSISAFVIGPAISGDAERTDKAPPATSAPGTAPPTPATKDEHGH